MIVFAGHISSSNTLFILRIECDKPGKPYSWYGWENTHLLHNFQLGDDLCLPTPSGWEKLSLKHFIKNPYINRSYYSFIKEWLEQSEQKVRHNDAS